ncbi:MAG: hypothetical protein ACO1SV_09820 [Fimbriimonas sp.]
MGDQSPWDDLLADPPPGISVLDRGLETATLFHQRKGMGCMNVFFSVWLTGWGAGCVTILIQFLRGIPNREGQTVTIWILLLFWGSGLGVGLFFLYLLTARKTFRLEEGQLVVRVQFLKWEKVRTVSRDAIQGLVQIKDGGEGDDSFPSWGLELKGKPKLTLIYRQPHATSLWLGKVIGHWARIEFQPLPPP